MREELQKTCNEFLMKREMMSKVFSWYNSHLHPVCAGIVLEKTEITQEEIEQCKKLLEKNTNMFSELRGTVFPAIVCHLAIKENPGEFLEQILKVYKMLRNVVLPSSYLSLVSLIIASFADESQYDSVIGKAKSIYDKMKVEHPFLTSGEDGPFAAMLALDGKSPECLIQDTEKCYGFLKGNFTSRNAVQSLSHVLAMGEGDSLEKCRRFMDIYMTFKMKGYKFDTDYFLSVLGAISLLPFHTNELVDDVISVTEYLEGKPGFGMLDSSPKERMAHAAIIVSKEYLSKCVGQVLDVPMFSATVAGVTTAIVMQSATMAVLV